jgi:hypothetical protein
MPPPASSNFLLGRSRPKSPVLNPCLMQKTHAAERFDALKKVLSALFLS